MALLLSIETSTEVCSVTLAKEGRIIATREDLKGQNHAQYLTEFIRELLDEQRIKATNLDAVAVSGGPGSYTGLRIGVSVAKGLCYGAQLPLIAITSLEALANQIMENPSLLGSSIPDSVLLCPMIDARRMEVYTAFYNLKGELIRNIQADIIDRDSYTEYLSKGLVYFLGNGANKCKSTLTHTNARFVENIHASARSMATLAEKKFIAQDFADVAYYEPFYLKDFVATTSSKNLLNPDKGKSPK